CGQLDRSESVRGRAAEVLGMRVDGHARAAIAAMLENEASDAIRETLILYLGSRAANDAGARTLLQDAAATDPSSALRQLAEQQLSGVPHG
ncbi:MAG TPA: HEAT repeat domain-containing protein, partial [Planctomycetota bacterium]|nr:HEAT repeat domain-containing protein [Planctomycetota bacterium]